MPKLLCAVLLAAFMLQCKEYEPPSNEPVVIAEIVKPAFPQISLRVNGELQKIVNSPATKELEPYFADLNDRMLVACAHPRMRAKITPELWKAYPTTLAQLIAGCYTFFTMNDMNAHLSFERVRRLYPGTYNCHTVAFTQLYMMHNIVECSTITAVDINWRILWGHYQMMRSFESGKIDLTDIKTEPGKRTGIWTFCYKPNFRDCNEAFQGAMVKYPLAHEVDLQISFLHDMEFKNSADNVLLFVSNAIDPGYTTKQQFNQLLEKMFDSLRPFQKGVVIYHAGGSSQYAVYELVRSLTDRRIKTVCRDELVWAPYYSNRGQKLKTYFDEISDRPAGQICSINLPR
jgi:hypothetical protein